MDARSEAERITDQVAASYASTYAAPRTTHERIAREIYGTEITDVDAVGPLTMHDLHRIARDLGVTAGETFVDVGCGPGGPALWLARQTGADIAGIDIVPGAIEQARQRAHDMGLDEHADFRVGDVTATGLPASAFAGAVSINTLLFVADKRGALHEVARILRPNGRFIVLTHDSELPLPGVTAAPVSNHHPLLRDAGFDVEAYDVLPDLGAEHRAFAEALLLAEREIIDEMGAEAGGRELRIARRVLDGSYSAQRRVLIVCRKGP